MSSRPSVLVAFVALSPAATLAEPPDARAETEGERDETGRATKLRKGATEWGLHGGAGLAENDGPGFGNRKLFALGGRIGRVVSNPRGPGILRGNLEISLDVVPLFLFFRGEAVYGFHGALIFRHYLSPDARVRPFVALGSGPLVTTADVPRDSSAFNFATSLGGGIVIPKSERAVYTIEVRLQHISNANTADRNPGVNAISFRVGMSLFR